MDSIRDSVFITNCLISSSVCLPTRAARINPLESARLNPIQQSPTSGSWAQHWFCFLRQMTTSHRHSLPQFERLEPQRYAPARLSGSQHEQYSRRYCKQVR